MTVDPRLVEDVRRVLQDPTRALDPSVVSLTAVYGRSRVLRRRRITTSAAAGLLAAVVLTIVTTPWTSHADHQPLPAVSPSPSTPANPGARGCQPADFDVAATQGPQDSDVVVSWLETYSYDGDGCILTQPPQLAVGSGAAAEAVWVRSGLVGWQPVELGRAWSLELVVVADAATCGDGAGSARPHGDMSLLWGGAMLPVSGLRAASCDGILYLEARATPAGLSETWPAFDPLFGSPDDEPTPPPVTAATAPPCEPAAFEFERVLGPRLTDTGQARMARFHNHGAGCQFVRPPRLVAGTGSVSEVLWTHQRRAGWRAVVVQAGDVLQLIASTQTSTCAEPEHVGLFRLEWAGSQKNMTGLDLPTCDGVVTVQLDAGSRQGDSLWFGWDWTDQPEDLPPCLPGTAGIPTFVAGGGTRSTHFRMTLFAGGDPLGSGACRPVPLTVSIVSPSGRISPVDAITTSHLPTQGQHGMVVELTIPWEVRPCADPVAYGDPPAQLRTGRWATDGPSQGELALSGPGRASLEELIGGVVACGGAIDVRSVRWL